ncbi:Tigger transposable element-derived protein 6 [Termitomyces sp. J132]|nr:Tigger transposable element-derived protein 6 [Termitomyces sp. J132]
MMASLYQNWLEQWDHELQAENQKVLLLQDNFAGHIVPEGLQSIHVENFEPNLTTHIQPMDQGIIRCFKAHHHAPYIECTIDCYNFGVTPSKIYDINQLKAMRLADTAWNKVDMTTIRHCWCKAGILPAMDQPATQPLIPVTTLLNTQLDPIEAIKEVEKALDGLKLTGVLQPQIG